MLNLGLADGIKIEALNGENVVFIYDLATLFDLDLLGLLNTNQKGTIHLSPGVSFNRVKVTLSSLTQLNLVKEVKIYEITRSVGPPTIDVASQNVVICKNQTATLSALTDSTNELVWYASATEAIPLAVTPYNGTYTTAPLLTATTIYVSARKIGCTIDSQRIPILINVIDAVALTVEPAISGCGSVNLRDAIINFDVSGNTTYTFFDASDTQITDVEAAIIQTSGIYYIQAENTSQGCISGKEPVNVTVNPIPQLEVYPLTYAVNIGDTVALLSTPNVGITWYDQNGTALASNIAGPFSQAGVYTFTVVANNGLCAKSLSVTINVSDPAGDCPIALEKVFADTQSSGSIITGGVSNDNAGIDQNLQTYSTITTGLGILGVGTTWQTLQWNTSITAGTPVTVKLGTEYSGLILAGAISIVGTKRDGGGNPINIGNIQPLSGDILNLLSGENSFEYTFVPANASGPQVYDGVRIIVGSLLSIAQNAKVYEAYYSRVANPIVCLPGDVEDIFSGVIDLGVGVLTSTVDVANEWNAVDNSDTTYATMYNGVGVLAAAEMTVKFRTASQADDILKVAISKPGTLLTAGLLSGFTIQCYMGKIPVGGLLDVNSSLLTVEIIGGGTDVFLSTNSQLPIYDRVKIRFGGAANVLDFLNVNTIKRAAKIEVIDSDGDNIIEVCSGNTVSIAQLPCTTYTWYDSEFGGAIVTTGPSYTIPNNLAAGTHIYYIQPVRNGCEVLSRTKITIIIGATAPQTAIATILVNAGTDTVFCSSSGSVTLTAQLSGTPLLNNPIFYWYSFDGTNQVLIPGGTSNTLNLTGLLPGTYTYYVGVSSDEYCETAQAERAQIIFTILPFSVASDIVINDAQECLGKNVVLQPNSLLTNPIYSWYFTNDSTQPITNGTFSGITYSINANGTLTVSGLTAINSPYVYYVSVSSDATCSNLDGTLQDVSVIINDTAPPTTNDTTQDFCLISNPTVANIQVVGTGIIWYDAPSNGNVVLPTTALIDNTTYYASQTDAVTSCESSIRLAVTIQINDTTPPTTSDTTQDFCLISNPTVANIQIVGTGVIWYDAPSNGNVILPTAALIDNMTYYASQTDAVTDCESSIRLTVTIQINDTAPPTTNDTAQEFCASGNATLADIQVNQTGVIWHDSPTNGNILASTTVLVSGTTYYASLVDLLTGCESAVRLAVAIQFYTNIAAVISGGSPSACINEPITYTTNAGMTNYSWNFTSGGHIVSGGTSIDNSITMFWDHIGSESISVSFTDTNGCTGNTSTSNVTVNACSNLSITKSANNMTPFVGDNVVFTVTVSNIGSTQFQNVTVDEQIQSGFQFLSASATNGTYNPTTGIWTIPVLNANEAAVLTITVKVLFSGDYENIASILTSEPEDPDDGNVAGISLSPLCLYVFNEFTPNEDGSNDFFNIKCAESYPSNTLDVFNRYGNLVYSTKGYKNNWKGIANVKGTFNGTELASGTHYYVFDTGDSKGVKTGWLQIMR